MICFLFVCLLADCHGHLLFKQESKIYYLIEYDNQPHRPPWIRDIVQIGWKCDKV